jgi:hypothetical protein
MERCSFRSASGVAVDPCFMLPWERAVGSKEDAGTRRCPPAREKRIRRAEGLW